MLQQRQAHRRSRQVSDHQQQRHIPGSLRNRLESDGNSNYGRQQAAQPPTASRPSPSPSRAGEAALPRHRTPPAVGPSRRRPSVGGPLMFPGTAARSGPALPPPRTPRGPCGAKAATPERSMTAVSTCWHTSAIKSANTEASFPPWNMPDHGRHSYGRGNTEGYPGAQDMACRGTHLRRRLHGLPNTPSPEKASQPTATRP